MPGTAGGRGSALGATVNPKVKAIAAKGGVRPGTDVDVSRVRRAPAKSAP